MKRILPFLFLVLVQSVFADSTRYSTEVDGVTFYFLINDDGETATITSTNEITIHESGQLTWVEINEYYSGDIIIPERVSDGTNSYIVTEIGDYAFYMCKDLKSIVIPENVSTIGYRSFDYCKSLTTAVLKDGIITIGDDAFSFCYSLTSIVLPNSLESIGEWTFNACYSLIEIILPQSLTGLGSCAFSYCTSLTSVNIPESITAIEQQVFGGCSSLNSLIIPESVTEIGRWAFSGCSSLTEVYFKETTTPEILEYAFEEVNENCILYVSEGLKDEYYALVSDYIPYDHIVELSADQFPSAIPTVTTTTKSVIGYYDLSGRKLTAPTGVTIIRYSDGTAEKILAK